MELILAHREGVTERELHGAAGESCLVREQQPFPISNRAAAQTDRQGTTSGKAVVVGYFPGRRPNPPQAREAQEEVSAKGPLEAAFDKTKEALEHLK